MEIMRKFISRYGIVMDTIGKRLRVAMIDRGMKQSEMIAKFEDAGHVISRQQLSKILNDGAALYTPEFLAAASNVLNRSVHYIVTGTEWTDPIDKFMSDEANEIGRLVDEMQPRMRQMMLQAAKASSQLNDDMLNRER